MGGGSKEMNNNDSNNEFKDNNNEFEDKNKFNQLACTNSNAS